MEFKSIAYDKRYVEPVELLESNFDILTDRNNYLFLVDARITQFKDKNFYVRDKIISIETAYSIGGIHIVKKVKLQ